MPAVEEEQRRDPLDGVARRDARVLVDVELRHADTSGVRAGEGVDHGRQRPARPAPGRPAVEEDGEGRSEHVVLERGIGDDPRLRRLDPEGGATSSTAGAAMRLVRRDTVRGPAGAALHRAGSAHEAKSRFLVSNSS